MKGTSRDDCSFCRTVHAPGRMMACWMADKRCYEIKWRWSRCQLRHLAEIMWEINSSPSNHAQQRCLWVHNLFSFTVTSEQSKRNWDEKLDIQPVKISGLTLQERIHSYSVHVCRQIQWFSCSGHMKRSQVFKGLFVLYQFFPNLNGNLPSFLLGSSVSLTPSHGLLFETNVDGNIFEIKSREMYLGWDCTLFLPRGSKQVVLYGAVWGACSDWGRTSCMRLWVSPRNKSFKRTRIWFVALSCPMLFASFIWDTAQALIFRYVKMLYFKKIFSFYLICHFKDEPEFFQFKNILFCF